MSSESHTAVFATVEGDRNSPTDEPLSLADRYRAVRRASEALCQPLQTEDYVVQSMPDVSPTRWHLAHTTWFFETFVLARMGKGYQPYQAAFTYLFNSYYHSVGPQFPRPRRGLLSRPTVKDIFRYRAYVDERMHELLGHLDPVSEPEWAAVIETGLQHEQQHQELILTDIKHVFSCNPLYPAYRPGALTKPRTKIAPLHWIAFEEGLRQIGHEGDGFCFDNELPRHRAFVPAFELTTRLITNGEFIKFMEDGGYEQPRYWLSQGWAVAQEQHWNSPLYWIRRDDGWWHFTLAGLRPVDPADPVCHVSYYEADAFARWYGAWLPGEGAWETAARSVPIKGNFAQDNLFHPAPLDETEDVKNLSQMFGDVWEWTSSPYIAYPGYREVEGALGEYNGKFMSDQMTLRGGSCVTPRMHLRVSYRNFFPPSARWQFTGFRLAR